jgi:hypothetical protein
MPPTDAVARAAPRRRSNFVAVGRGARRSTSNLAAEFKSPPRPAFQAQGTDCRIAAPLCFAQAHNAANLLKSLLV